MADKPGVDPQLVEALWRKADAASDRRIGKAFVELARRLDTTSPRENRDLIQHLRTYGEELQQTGREQEQGSS